MERKTKSRKKIPAVIEAEVMFSANLNCCVHSNKRGDHIHHIDGDNSNNEFDNLVLLCFDCHNDASVKGSLSKKLSAKTILKYREHHYNVIKAGRDISLKKLDTSIKHLSFDDLVNATTTSIIIFEISKIKEEYYADVRMDRNQTLKKLLKFSKQNNIKVCYEVFSFLQFVAYETRGGLPSDMALTVEVIIESYFPPRQSDIKNTQIVEIGRYCISVAYTLIYDSSIHHANYAIMRYGYAIVKNIYLYAKKNKLNELTKDVLNAYSEMENHFNRPERNDLEEAKMMLAIFKNDLEVSSHKFPVLPDSLYKLVQRDE